MFAVSMAYGDLHAIDDACSTPRLPDGVKAEKAERRPAALATPWSNKRLSRGASGGDETPSPRATHVSVLVLIFFV